MPFALTTKDGTRPGSPATVFACFLHFDFCFTMWVLLGALGVVIAGKQGLNLNAAQKGLMVAIPTLGGSLFRFPLGILSDRYGSKRVGIAMIVFLFIPLVLGWLVNVNFSSLLAIGIMLGVSGASFSVALPLASRWYPPEKQGLVMGLAAAGNIGTVVAIIFAPILAKVLTPHQYLPYYPANAAHVASNLIYPLIPAPYGWHAVLGLTIIPMAVLLIVFTLLAKESPTRPQHPVTVYLSALKKADMWWFCLLYSITFGGFVGLGTFLPIFFNDQYGLPAVDANGWTTLATAGGLAALAAFLGSTLRPLGGFIADKFGGARTLTVMLVVIAVVYGIAALVVEISLPLVYMGIIMALGVSCLGMGNGAVFQMVPQRFRTEIGVATGLIGEFGGLGGFFLPTLLGSVKQVSGSYASGLLVLSGFVVCALVLLLVLMARNAGWRVVWAPTPEVQLEWVNEEIKVVRAKIKAVTVNAQLEAAKAELETLKAELEAGEAALEAEKALKVAETGEKATIEEAMLDPAIG
jgi:MFS transporter, NNP family, nitrate/nitrite transporter